MATSSTSERNQACFRKLLDEIINAGRLDLCDRYLAVDRVDYQDYGLPPGAVNGHAGFRRVLGPFIEAFPDFRIDIDFMLDDGYRLVAYNTTTGTNNGSFMDQPPTGKSFKANGVDIFRFNDEGKIAAHWGVFDTFGMMVQLGLVPSPRQSQTA